MRRARSSWRTTRSCRPAGSSPLSLGADIVVHSTTKYINGHSDVVGGAVIARDARSSHEQLGMVGAIASASRAPPFDSYLTLRGLRTLHVRLREHGRNAQARRGISREADRQREARLLPGPRRPIRDTRSRSASRRGFGAIVTLEVRGRHRRRKRFSEALELFSLAESLGGVESLVAHPATMTHAAMAPEARAAAGLVDGLLRLSIGIESIDDLLRDLANGAKSVG